MWDFDGDEAIFFMAAAIIAVGLGFSYYRLLIHASSFGKSMSCRQILAVIPPVAIIPTYIVLRRWADARAGHLDYTLLFLAGAAAWIFVAAFAIAPLGISIRDDAIERNNPAATIASGGLMLNFGIIYAFSNIGMGPTIWTTILPALAATFLLIMMWLLAESIGGGVAEAITIDRDSATALRLAGATMGCAIILGRAAAGKWVSWDQTWGDLVQFGWPAVILAFAAGVLHRMLRPSAERPQPDRLAHGFVPAIVFVAAGILVVATGKNGFHPSQW